MLECGSAVYRVELYIVMRQQERVLVGLYTECENPDHYINAWPLLLLLHMNSIRQTNT